MQVGSLYNWFMGVIDFVDKKGAEIADKRRRPNPYESKFFWFLSIMLVNAWSIYCTYNDEYIPIIQFLRDVREQIGVCPHSQVCLLTCSREYHLLTIFFKERRETRAKCCGCRKNTRRYCRECDRCLCDDCAADMSKFTHKRSPPNARVTHLLSSVVAQAHSFPLQFLQRATTLRQVRLARLHANRKQAAVAQFTAALTDPENLGEGRSVPDLNAALEDEKQQYRASIAQLITVEDEAVDCGLKLQYLSYQEVRRNSRLLECAKRSRRASAPF